MISAAASNSGHHPRDLIIDALMALAAERDWDRIEISDIAERAGLSLATFRDVFPSKGAILGAFARRIDHVVLAGHADDLESETVKERLFDVLMRRIDALTPYKAALKRMAPAIKRDPLTMAALNQTALNAMRFMLASAGIATEGPLGAVKLQGTVLAFAKILDVWFHDDDPGLARTMAALDEQLKRGGMIVNRLDDLCRITAPLAAMLHRATEGRRPFTERPRAPYGDPDADPGI